jgi:hypothetical protein
MKRDKFVRGERVSIPKYRPGTKVLTQDVLYNDHYATIVGFADGLYEIKMSGDQRYYITEEELDEFNDEGLYE